jgi:hypothetical protein
MNFPENPVAENFDEIIRRAGMRRQQEHIHAHALCGDSSEDRSQGVAR